MLRNSRQKPCCKVTPPMSSQSPPGTGLLIAISFDTVTTKQRSDADSAVDVVEERLDFEELDLTAELSRIVVGTRDELVQRETHSEPWRNFGALRFLP